MKSKIFILTLGIICGCQRQSTDQIISSNRLFSSDSATITYRYNSALQASQNNEWNYNSTIPIIDEQADTLNRHKLESSYKSSRYDYLLGLIKTWPVRVSKGYVYKDDYTGEIVKENIREFKWITYEDYLSKRFSEYQLDTIHLGWRRIENQKIGFEIWLPTTYNVFEKRNRYVNELSFGKNRHPRRSILHSQN